MNSKIFDILKKVASANDQYPRARLSAALVKGSKIISIGINRKKSDPFAAKFSKNSQAIFSHAEIHAIKQALREYTVDDIAGSDLYICRVKYVPSAGGYDETWGLAKPCSGCMRAIAEFGIANVYFTTDNGYEVL